MKLYYSPGACSLASHIVAREAGVALDLAKVDLKAKTVEGGGDFLQVNPKGYVPALQLDDGQVLTENPAILQYLADRKPEAGLAPPAGSFAHYRWLEMVGYLNAEVHKAWSVFFKPNLGAEERAGHVAHLKKRYAVLDKHLAGREFLVGDRFTAADAYLNVVTNWGGFLKVDLAEFANVAAFQQRVAKRPAVQAAMKAEGLVK